MLRTACSRVATGLSVLSVLTIFSVSWAGAQSPSGPLPRKLTLAQAEELLVQRNLAVLAARYKIDSSRAARLIAGYKPNPISTSMFRTARLRSSAANEHEHSRMTDHREQERDSCSFVFIRG